MTKDTINLVHKLDDIPKKDFRTILPKNLEENYKDLAADLLDGLLYWNPKDRMTCDKALKHDFFKYH